MKTFNHPIFFQEQEFKNRFYARTIEADEWGAQFGATHVIIFTTGSEERFAEIGTTVLYIYTDEDAEGQPVKEKWNIRHY